MCKSRVQGEHAEGVMEWKREVGGRDSGCVPYDPAGVVPGMGGLGSTKARLREPLPAETPCPLPVPSLG